MLLLWLTTSCAAPVETGDSTLGSSGRDTAASSGSDTACVDADGDGACAAVDCDDQDPYTFAGAADSCDGVDNDCDGLVDEGFDLDGDGVSSCAGDCDDFDAATSPGNAEICDHRDNDCDGLVDEGFDQDGDGQKTCEGDCDDTDPNVFSGNPEICNGGKDDDCDSTTQENGDVDGDGWTICAGDCDDAESRAYPHAKEACDGVDNDCNGVVDEVEACWSCADHGSVLDCVTPTTWSGAEVLCEAWGGHLVVISSAGLNDTVAGFAWDETGGQRSCIGYDDLYAEGVFVGVDGSSLGYANWDVGQPDNLYNNEDCVDIDAGAQGVWDDSDCTLSMPFVCSF